MIVRIDPVIHVATPHGYGQAIFLIDYGLDTNSVWVVRIKGGKVKHYFSEEIRIPDNEMNNRGIDLDIPKNWDSYTMLSTKNSL
jgi:hypothetical protein